MNAAGGVSSAGRSVSQLRSDTGAWCGAGSGWGGSSGRTSQTGASSGGTSTGSMVRASVIADIDARTGTEGSTCSARGMRGSTWTSVRADTVVDAARGVMRNGPANSTSFNVFRSVAVTSNDLLDFCD